MMNKFLLFAAAALLLFSSCEEELLPIVTDPEPAPLLDTTYVNATVSPAQQKVVLIEEFTGVRCTNCPAGHTAIKDILNANPGRVVAVAIHAGKANFSLATPFSDQEDLNTVSLATNLFTIFNKPNGIPYGIVDRLNGSNTVTLWSGICDARLGTETKANVELKIISYNAATRELRYEVAMELMDDLDTLLYLSTGITENGIVSRQELGGTAGHDDNYIHDHILRDMPQFATALNPNLEPAAQKGRVFIRQYAVILPDKWKAENCHLVAWIHKSVEVLQAAEVSIQ